MKDSFTYRQYQKFLHIAFITYMDPTCHQNPGMKDSFTYWQYQKFSHIPFITDPKLFHVLFTSNPIYWLAAFVQNWGEAPIFQSSEYIIW